VNYENAGYVYSITNTVTGKHYIGSTTNYKSRWSTHRSRLRRNAHHSFILQRSWNKHGEQAFAFKVLLVCPADQRVEYEKRLMVLQSYNVAHTPMDSAVRIGRVHSAETRAKMSAAHMGVAKTQEHRANMSKARKGVVRSDEFRENARIRQTGVSPSEETRARLGAAMALARADEMSRNREKTLRVYEAAAAGAKVPELCATVGFSMGTFYTHCKRLGLPTLKRRRTK